MTRPTRPPTGRMRPTGSFGPVRDEARDSRIIDAALDLIVESGYGTFTMSAVAARAHVAKATVYRRWASREDLVADALESVMFEAAPPSTTTAETLRDDLLTALTISSACLQPRGARFTAALAAATGSHAEIADTLRDRYIAGQRETIASCLRRSRERGELAAEQLERLLSPDSLEVTAAVGVMVFPEELLGGILDADGITRLVDQVLLPLIRHTPTT